MLRTRNLTLTSTPTLLTFSDGVEGPSTISIQNTSNSDTVYLGGPSVSAEDYGISLSPSQMWSADLGAYDKLYAVGTSTIAVLILER